LNFPAVVVTLAIMRLDSHVHILPEYRTAGLIRWMRRAFPDHPITPDYTWRDVVGDLREAGVERFFAFHFPLRPSETGFLNKFSLRVASRVRGMVPFLSFHVENSHPGDLVAWWIGEKRAFWGVKLHPFVQGFDPWDERLYPAYEWLEEHGYPIFLHTGFDELYGKSMPPEKVLGILRRFPRLMLVVIHMFYPRFKEAFAFLEEGERVYLDATNVFSYVDMDWPPGTRKSLDLDWFREEIERWSHRIMFGSDHPAGAGTLQDVYDILDVWNFSPKTRARLEGETALELLEVLGYPL